MKPRTTYSDEKKKKKRKREEKKREMKKRGRRGKERKRRTGTDWRGFLVAGTAQHRNAASSKTASDNTDTNTYIFIVISS